MGRIKIEDKKTGFISSRTSKATEDFFRENKKLTGSGSVSALVLDSFPTIYGITISMLKADFTREELLTILTSFNGKKVNPERPGSPVQFEPIKNHKFKDFDIEVLNQKFSNRSRSDRFIIELWANKFWNGVTVGGVRNTTDDPEEYIR